MAQEGFEQVELVVRTMAQTAVDNETYFSDLDAVVGDGDFGYSLARGLRDRARRLGRPRPHGRRDVPAQGRGDHHQPHRGHLRPALGHGLPAGRRAVAGAAAIGGDETLAMLRAAIEGVKQRGQSDVGDKTLLDALVPAADVLEERLRAGDDGAAALAQAAATAREAAEATQTMLAKRGRASYTGRAQHREPRRRRHRASRSCSRSSPRPGPRVDRARGHISRTTRGKVPR